MSDKQQSLSLSSLPLEYLQCARGFLIQEGSRKHIQNVSEISSHQLQNLLGKKIFAAYKDQTVASLMGILDTEIDAQGISLQKKVQDTYIAEGKVVKGTNGLPENNKKELAASRSLLSLVQLAFSPEDAYIVQNTLFKDDPDYWMPVVISSKKVRAFAYDLGLNHLDDSCTTFKKLLSQFVPLSYTLDQKTQTTNRIGRIHDKWISFKLEKVPYTPADGLAITPGEKRKKEYRVCASVFESLDALIRGQHHILENLEEKFDSYTQTEEAIRKLFTGCYDGMFEQVVNTKDLATKRTLESLLSKFTHSTSFYVKSSMLYQFEKIVGKNNSIDTNHLLAGLRRLGARGKEVAEMCTVIGSQVRGMEEYVTVQKSAMQDLFGDLYGLFHARKHTDYSEFNKLLIIYLQKAKAVGSFSAEPYSTFFSLVNALVGPITYETGSRGVASLKRPIEEDATIEKLRLYYFIFNSIYQAYQLEQSLKTKEKPFTKMTPSFIHDQFNLSSMIAFSDRLATLEVNPSSSEGKTPNNKPQSFLSPLVVLIEKMQIVEEEGELIALLHQVQQFM